MHKQLIIEVQMSVIHDFEAIFESKFDAIKSIRI